MTILSNDDSLKSFAIKRNKEIGAVTGGESDTNKILVLNGRNKNDRGEKKM